VSSTATQAAGAFTLTAAAAGALRAAGPLTFATARAARLAGLAAVRSGAEPLQIDCAGISGADSAGLAVVLDWFAAAKLAGRSLRLSALPQDLLALARISDLERLLTQGL
jgi:phospholipid transport system transporter-binding protein